MDHNLKDNCGKYLLFIAKLTFVFMNMYFVADHCIYKYVSMLSDNLMNKESVSVYTSMKLNTQDGMLLNLRVIYTIMKIVITKRPPKRLEN